MKKNFTGIRQQGGAVLLVALVMLLLLTLISLSSMRGAALQENMASNLREGNVTFQAAEAGLRAGEKDAYNKFMKDSLDYTRVTGDYTGMTDLAEVPKYAFIKLADIRTSTEIGAPDEGAFVLIESVGSGYSLDKDDKPNTRTELRSTYLVEE